MRGATGAKWNGDSALAASSARARPTAARSRRGLFHCAFRPGKSSRPRPDVAFLPSDTASTWRKVSVGARRRSCFGGTGQPRPSTRNAVAHRRRRKRLIAESAVRSPRAESQWRRVSNGIVVANISLACQHNGALVRYLWRTIAYANAQLLHSNCPRVRATPYVTLAWSHLPPAAPFAPARSQTRPCPPRQVT